MKAYWERVDFDYCDQCDNAAKWEAKYQILEFYFCERVCSEHKHTGQMICFSKKQPEIVNFQ